MPDDDSLIESLKEQIRRLREALFPRSFSPGGVHVPETGWYVLRTGEFVRPLDRFEHDK